MHRGKKISDPVPKARGNKKYEDPLTGLGHVWNTVGKARSELRKIESRLGDVDRAPPSERLNLTGETSITDYSELSGTSANQTYNIPTKHLPRGDVVDSYGWSKHVHQNKYLGQGVRKVSRLDSQSFQPMMTTQRGRHVTNHLMSDLPQDLPNRDPGLSRNDPTGASPKKVDFNNQLELRRINHDGTYTDSFSVGAEKPGFPQYTDYRNENLESYFYPNSQSTLTDSRALRETEIRFLNNPSHSETSKQKLDPYDIRWNKVSNRLTHVDVKVPSASNYRSSSQQPVVEGSSQELIPSSSRTLRTGVAGGSDRAGNREVKVDGYSSATSEGSECSNGKRLKKHLKDFDRDTGALAKLKERIRQQRLLNSASPVTDTEARGENQYPSSTDQLPERTRHLHDEADLVEMKRPEIAWELERRYEPPLPRKVAAGPPPPVYKGFNEVESKFKLVKPAETTRKTNKKKTTIQIQEKKREENAEFIPELKVVEEKPMKRVVAMRDKSAKNKVKDMITTSSWRTGQQVILQTLGPSKSTKHSKTRETTKEKHNNDVYQKGSGQHQTTERPEPLGGAEMISDDAVRSVPKVLSDEARQVLNDLHIGQQDDAVKSDAKMCERPKKPAVKRKAPKQQDSEKLQPMTKSRHYDPDNVRQYMLKQKEQRMKRKREQHQAQQKAEKERQQHLDDLYKKQKTQKKMQPIVKTTKSRTGKSTDSTRLIQVAWEDQIRTVVGSESDKENDELNVSDDSSTITNDDSVGDSTPVATPRDTDNATSKTLKHGYEAGPMEIDTLIGQSRLYQDSDRRDFGLFPSSDQYRTRAERIQAIKDTAATLQSRLQAESHRLGDKGASQHAASLPESTGTNTAATRWPSSSTGGAAPRAVDGAFTRHDRIAGTQEDFSVFTSNLPGVQSLSSHLEKVDRDKSRDVAATRIQAAYHGKTVRQALDWKLPSGKSLGNKIQSAGSGPQREKYDDLGEDSSTFSDITVTDESDAESTHAHTRQIGNGLAGRDYHPGDRYRREVLEEARKETDSLTNARYSVPAVNWDRPSADPYSTFNVFTRNYQHSERERRIGLENKPAVESQLISAYRDTTGQPLGAVTPVREDRQSPEGFHNATPERTRESHSTPKLRQEEDNNKGKQLIESDAVTSHRSEDIRSRLLSASFHPVIEDFAEDKDEDVTIEGDNSYTQSFESEPEEKTPSNYRSKAEPVAMETRGTPETKKSYVARKEDFMESEVSSVAEDVFPISLHSKISLESKSQNGTSAVQHPARFSPNALERKMAAELNLLESMEESMRQLSGVERSRAVSMAQQETVSVAQILKARQQVHDVQMKHLQLKARQETNVASQQLEEARKRAAEAAQNAVQMMAMVRGGETSQSLKETSKRLIERQAESARATAEAAKYLSRGAVRDKTNIPSKASDPIQGKQSKSISHRAGGEDYSELSQTSTGRSAPYTRDYTDLDTISKSMGNLRQKSRSTSGRSSQSPDLVTANDSQDDKKSSSIRTASGAAAKDDSESIGEDISYAKGSGDDYSMNFDESMTEDEVEEKSFRMVLPSESHRRKAKHQRTQSDVSVTSEEMSVSSTKFGEDLSSLFIGEDSFNRFTTEMVNQYMREEELRAQHQASLLKLREKALREKTKAELAWLDQQRKRMRNKGSDDAYPQIKKRQRGIILKLEQEQAEIKRLQEANLLATKERQIMLRQQQELQKLRKSTKNTWEKVHGSRPSRSNHRGFRQDDIHTEDEVTLPYEDKSEGGEDFSKKDVKSDSEIYADVRGKRKSETSAMTKLRNVHMDQRYLTAREKKLRDRRKNAEQLLAWKKKLDDEEQKIYELEKKAIDLWDGSADKPVRGSENKVDTKKGEDKTPAKGKQANLIADSSGPKKDQPAQFTRSESETSISEAVSRSQTSRSQTSRSQFSRSEVSRTDASRSHILNSKAPAPSKSEPAASKGRHQRSESEGSIPEDIQSHSSSNAEDSASVGTSRKQIESTKGRSEKSYGDESFVSNSSKTPGNRKSPLKKLLSPPGLLFDPSRSPLSPGKHYKRGSESESEESLHAETASDQSDAEGRVRVLTDELERRKLQLDRLKKEHEKKKQEKLKAHEQSLMKQIQVYDNCIKRMSDEKTELEHERLVAGKKPQIKQPKGRDHRQRSSQEEGSPQKNRPPPQRSESESSRSSQSSSFEESREGLDSTQLSPAVQPDSVKKVSPLASISERNETPLSQRARQSLLGKDSSDKRSTSPALLDDSDLAQRLPEDAPAKSIDNVSLSLPSRLEDKISLALKEDKVDSKPAEEISSADVSPKSAVFEIMTARSEVSEQINEKDFSQNSEDTLGFKPLGVVQTVQKDDTVESAGKILAEVDNGDSSLKSDRSEAYSTQTDKTLSENSDASYTEDFSEVETTGKGKTSRSLGKQDSVMSQDDISEHFSVASDISEKSSLAPLLDLRVAAVQKDTEEISGKQPDKDETREVRVSDEESTPVQTPRNVSENLMEFTPADPEIGDKIEDTSVGSPMKAETSGKVTEDADSELENVINSTAAAVEQFDSTPFSSPEQKSPSRSTKQWSSEKLIDSITDALTERVLKDSMSAMSQIAARRSTTQTPPATSQKPPATSQTPPATLPKPKKAASNASLEESAKQNLSSQQTPTIFETPATTAVDDTSPVTTVPIPSTNMVSQQRPAGSSEAEMRTDSEMSNMLNEAISDMISIRNRKRERFQTPEALQEENEAGSNGIARHEELSLSGIPRPGSPVPGEKTILTQEEISKLDEDLTEIYGTEDEYHDDDEWFRGSPVPNKPPPPYPGTAEQGPLPYQLSRTIHVEEPQYAVPHNKEDVKIILRNAVEIYWMKRRYGESLDNVEVPESYFSSEDNDVDMDSVSRRAYKKLLFQLAGEIIREVYKVELEEDEPTQPWKKTKAKRQKYYKGLDPPTTVEVLTELVQDTSVLVLGLNGSQKVDPRVNKWGVRKKKDNVDSILAQELREDEPNWVNYDTDELAVKMHLTDTIFDSLLQDTVDTMNNIFKKRKSRTEEFV